MQMFLQRVFLNARGTPWVCDKVNLFFKKQITFTFVSLVFEGNFPRISRSIRMIQEHIGLLRQVMTKFLPFHNSWNITHQRN